MILNVWLIIVDICTHWAGWPPQRTNSWHAISLYVYVISTRTRSTLLVWNQLKKKVNSKLDSVLMKWTISNPRGPNKLTIIENNMSLNNDRREKKTWIRYPFFPMKWKETFGISNFWPIKLDCIQIELSIY